MHFFLLLFYINNNINVFSGGWQCHLGGLLLIFFLLEIRFFSLLVLLMGGLCSKSSDANDELSNSKVQVVVNPIKSYEQFQEPVPLQKIERPESGLNPDDFYDGIPRFTQKSRSVRSTQAAVAKVSEVSLRLGRAGTVGLGKAMNVLDTLGSSMTNLHPSSGFGSGVGNKSSDLSILAFEVANTIVKGSNLMQSLSKESVRQLKEVVLLSNGVQNLVSNDMEELLNIVAADKRKELKIFTGEVVRFGNRTKDPQWHNLNRYFEKISRELMPQNQEEAELVMEHLMTLVHYTAELYQELQVLDRFEQDYQRKRQEEDNSAQKGDGFAIWAAELKSQRKLVKNLKKKSLWSRSLEEVMERLVDIVHFLLLEMHNAFGRTDNNQIPFNGSMSNHQRLGPAGLALHYANVVMQIDTLVARSSSLPPNTRDALYQSLPPGIKSALRSKLQCFNVKEELTVSEIKDRMEKTLEWLVPVANNTAKAHHGFGWVGEWANTGSDVNQKSAAGPTEVIRIETLHHADREKTEAYILELVLWLHHLINKVKIRATVGGKSIIKYPVHTALQNTDTQTKHEPARSASLTPEDQEILQNASKRRRIPGISKSQDFDRIRLKKYDRLSKSSSYSLQGEKKESITMKRHPSHLPIIPFGVDKQKVLDVIDRVDVLRSSTELKFT